MRIILRSIARLMLSAGFAAIVAVLFVMNEPSPEWTKWILPIRHIALAIGIPSLVAAIVASVLLPSRKTVSAVDRQADAGLNVIAVLPLAFLACIALWQTPLVLAWWAESQRLIQQITSGERDPLGFWIIPAILISAPAVIAALVIVLFAVAAIAFATGLPASRARLLAASIVLAAGLIVSSSLVLPEIRAYGAQLLGVMDGSPDTVEVAAAMQEAGARHDGFASTLLTRFQWILAGYGVALAVILYERGPSRL